MDKLHNDDIIEGLEEKLETRLHCGMWTICNCTKYCPVSRIMEAKLKGTFCSAAVPLSSDPRNKDEA